MLHVSTSIPTFDQQLNMIDEPLSFLGQERTRPGREALQKIMAELG
jgi:hypothetical protein